MKRPKDDKCNNEWVIYEIFQGLDILENQKIETSFHFRLEYSKSRNLGCYDFEIFLPLEYNRRINIRLQQVAIDYQNL